MNEEQNHINIKAIGHIRTDFPSKFGIPRQSGIIEELKGTITLEPEYRQSEIVRGLEEFSHIWLIWGFSEIKKNNWSATVAPPRLGGKEKKGVFATRSPYRPNPLGLSCVKLEHIEYTKIGPIIHVAGVDMADGTPIYDIKPYIPFTDCHREASEGYTAITRTKKLTVIIEEECASEVPADKLEAIRKILEQDPRPAYDHDENAPYGVTFADYDIHFKVKNNELNVFEIVKIDKNGLIDKIKR